MRGVWRSTCWTKAQTSEIHFIPKGHFQCWLLLWISFLLETVWCIIGWLPTYCLIEDDLKLLILLPSPPKWELRLCCQHTWWILLKYIFHSAAGFPPWDLHLNIFHLFLSSHELYIFTGLSVLFPSICTACTGQIKHPSFSLFSSSFLNLKRSLSYSLLQTCLTCLFLQHPHQQLSEVCLPPFFSNSTILFF